MVLSPIDTAPRRPDGAAGDLVRRALVWDNHTCMPLRPFDEAFLPQLERFRRSGINVVSLNVGFGTQSIEPHIRMLAHFRRWLAARSADYCLVTGVADIEAAVASGRLAVFFDIEGAQAVDDQLSLVALYYDLGVRWMSMAYNKNNRAAGGCLDSDTGLTDFGRDLVREMNRVGMLVCCSHTGERSSTEVIALSADPVIFSHSNPRDLWDHPRNVRDGLIRACAARGGVIGLSGIGLFLGDAAVRPETFARHVDYVVELAGIDHVSIGLDYVFDQAEMFEFVRTMKDAFPADILAAAGTALPIMAPERIADVADVLSGLGYSEADLRKVLGLNLMRIARSVWK